MLWQHHFVSIYMTIQKFVFLHHPPCLHQCLSLVLASTLVFSILITMPSVTKATTTKNATVALTTRPIAPFGKVCTLTVQCAIFTNK